ncbi:TolC family protein [Moritella viscosa]|uniref:Outer membrane protein n=1 Tax=Moritella viscosa TaxID=80854 RepID=A0ABY1HFI7_9GAMM|nr:TolC family protein [Moritella viscosa]SGY93727.1 Outer membrane protein [Moritella viscosa]SGZ05086.1 Outer membrane protein [Moritella viscosa]SHO26709.1 Outer membrane protein [Moritella viscosa]
MPSKIYLGLFALLTINANAQQLTLAIAEDTALQRDPSAILYSAQQARLKAQGISQSQLADPMIKFGLSNVPVDNFSLSDDPMTQFSLGLSQQFSAGDTLELTAKGFSLQTQQSIQFAENRQLELKLQIRELWFDISFAKIAQTILAKNKQLFSQHVTNLYRQFELGYRQNQDLIKAELELAKFDDKIAAFAQQEQALRGQLVSWIGPQAFDEFDSQLPTWPQSLEYAQQANLKHYRLLADHPQVLAAQQAIDVAQNNIATANESYKPAFKVDIGYGHREALDMASGSSRSDLISGSITMNIPLFTSNRQDQVVIAAAQGRGIKQAEKDLLLIKFNGILNGAIANFSNTQARMQRYQDTLLVQAKANSDAAIQGYQANTNDFEQVIKALMDEQALTLEYQQLHFQNLKTLARIRYFQAL